MLIRKYRRRKDEKLYQWVKRLSQEFAGADEARLYEAMSAISNETYMVAIHRLPD